MITKSTLWLASVLLFAQDVPLGQMITIRWYIDVPATRTGDSYVLPAVPQAVIVYRNGLRMRDCGRFPNCDFLRVGSTINFIVPLEPDDSVIIDFLGALP